MRRVPLPTAGILVVERPGRQVRAEVRRAAVHRDARHGAPLKSPEHRPVGRAAPSRHCSSGDSFLPPSSCDSRQEASCYTVNSAIGGQYVAKFLLGQIEIFRFFLLLFLVMMVDLLLSDAVELEPSSGM
uniref:Uncharacterized protein n=1 Tax=Triticum urartu TaxID=4572 RepID=A0A8R7K1B7_TRIUA